MSPTVPNEVIREKTNPQCRAWGGPTVSGHGELEVWGGAESSEASPLSAWELVLWKDDETVGRTKPRNQESSGKEPDGGHLSLLLLTAALREHGCRTGS